MYLEVDEDFRKLLEVDEDFRKLPDEGLKEHLAWDRERFTKLTKAVEARQGKR